MNQNNKPLSSFQISEISRIANVAPSDRAAEFQKAFDRAHQDFQVIEIMGAKMQSMQADVIRMDWLQQMIRACEGRLLTRLFMPDEKPFREKIDELMDFQARAIQDMQQ